MTESLMELKTRNGLIGWIQSGWKYWSSTAVFLLFALSLSVDSGYSYGAILLVLGALISFIARPKSRPVQWNRDDSWLMGMFCLYGLSFVFYHYVHVFEMTGLDKPSRFMVAFIPYLFLRRHPISVKFLWYGIALGAISGSVLGFYQKVILGAFRAHGFQHPINFGNIGVLLGLLSFVGVLYFVANKDKKSMGLMLVAGFAGLLVSVFSGSRGGWVAVPMALIYIFWQARGLLGPKRVKQILAGFVVLIAVVVSVPQTGVGHRIGQAASDIQNYTSGINEDTSVGMRFQMWKAAYHMFLKSPVIGVGKFNVQHEKQLMADQGMISQAVVHFGHAHNEYLTNLSEYGLIGFVLLLLVYLLPMRLFAREVIRYSDNWQCKSIAMAGVLVTVSFMDFALTQSMFSHNVGVMMYVLSIVTIWATLRNFSQESNKR